jgi:hypothetical protein
VVSPNAALPYETGHRTQTVTWRFLRKGTFREFAEKVPYYRTAPYAATGRGGSSWAEREPPVSGVTAGWLSADPADEAGGAAARVLRSCPHRGHPGRRTRPGSSPRPPGRLTLHRWDRIASEMMGDLRSQAARMNTTAACQTWSGNCRRRVRLSAPGGPARRTLCLTRSRHPCRCCCVLGGAQPMNAVRFCALSSLCKPGLSRGWLRRSVAARVRCRARLAEGRPRAR